MRYFVQPFDYFGELAENQQTDEWYMRNFTKVEHIREHLRDSFNLDGSLNEAKFLQECSSYHGFSGGDYGICIFPGGKVEMKYTLFRQIKWKEETLGLKDNTTSAEDLKDSSLWWCELKIWLTKKDIINIFKVK